MDIIQLGLVTLLCAMTALLANMSASVFHDGIRPILPQVVEGNMSRRDAGSVAFGLSIGFVASVGISFTLSTGLLNPWLLFLPTDILGVMMARRWQAALAGGLWGILVVTSLSGVNAVLTGLPVDAVGALGELGTPVMTAFALFPLLAIFYQFGWKAGAISAAVIVLARLREWFPHARLVGWKYELAGTSADAFAKAWRQIEECRLDACVLNGAAYGPGFAVCVADRSVHPCAGNAALAQWLGDWLAARPRS